MEYNLPICLPFFVITSSLGPYSCPYIMFYIAPPPQKCAPFNLSLKFAQFPPQG